VESIREAICGFVSFLVNECYFPHLLFLVFGFTTFTTETLAAQPVGDYAS
jgi:hypothetical protein